MVSLDIRRELLDKKTCRAEARKLISEGSVKGMNEIQLAREIYFHALAYYSFDNDKLFRWIRSHANPIDINDGGDKLYRRLVYNVIWMMPEQIKR